MLPPMTTIRTALISWLLGALVAASLGGCSSETCTSAAVVGRYIMRSGPDAYELNLRKDGTGSLSKNGIPETFTWTWWENSEQPFLRNLSGATIDDLEARAGSHTPPDIPKTQSGDFGLFPQCSAGVATELDLRVDGKVRFDRVD
jgi:hypothetical protein